VVDIRFRATDAGKRKAVYAFFWAPASIVQGAAISKDRRFAAIEKADGDPPIACKLAQLDQSGQLQAVSAESLRASVIEGESAETTSITIDNIEPTRVAGSSACVGSASTDAGSAAMFT